MNNFESEVTVRTAKELKKAVLNKEKNILVEGKLAKKLEPLEKLKNAKNGPDVDSNTNPMTAAVGLASATAIPTGVWVLIIVSLSLIVLFALYKNYDMEVSKGDAKMKFTRNEPNNKAT
ncbi:hypothetical protein [Exiguobacterium sp. AB2]|uniref:hypothetical protein n=1 Tax=Exiguobacterium sp. AB2 TaxID=1484479 RepID=UPI0004A93828|nr:hypothetical protein [Exiguobacterium sp. AB2]KDN57631.1 hypothetical protein DI14_10510 [Exiguobacterium sp. AB2]